jgi:hypothetical protein
MILYNQILDRHEYFTCCSRIFYSILDNVWFVRSINLDEQKRTRKQENNNRFVRIRGSCND